jgi:hypothetical protein
MKRVMTGLALALAVTLVALACGRYGPPQRPERPQPEPASVPLTDPAVPR